MNSSSVVNDSGLLIEFSKGPLFDFVEQLSQTDCVELVRYIARNHEPNQVLPWSPNTYYSTWKGSMVTYTTKAPEDNGNAGFILKLVARTPLLFVPDPDEGPEGGGGGTVAAGRSLANDLFDHVLYVVSTKSSPSVEEKAAPKVPRVIFMYGRYGWGWHLRNAPLTTGSGRAIDAVFSSALGGDQAKEKEGFAACYAGSVQLPATPTDFVWPTFGPSMGRLALSCVDVRRGANGGVDADCAWLSPASELFCLGRRSTEEGPLTATTAGASNAYLRDRRWPLEYSFSICAWLSPASELFCLGRRSTEEGSLTATTPAASNACSRDRRRPLEYSFSIECGQTSARLHLLRSFRERLVGSLRRVTRVSILRTSIAGNWLKLIAVYSGRLLPGFSSLQKDEKARQIDSSWLSEIGPRCLPDFSLGALSR